MSELQTIKVFCYGSNMNTKRLQARCPSAKFLFKTMLPGYKLRLNKRSGKEQDGFSGKGNMALTGNKEDAIHGVVFEIDMLEKPRLDAAEGKGNGYNEESIILKDSTGAETAVNVFIADSKSVDDSLIPYDWYMQHIIVGAKEFDLPKEYIDWLERIPKQKDQKPGREKKELAIYR